MCFITCYLQIFIAKFMSYGYIKLLVIAAAKTIFIFDKSIFWNVNLAMKTHD